ncbi:MAG: hypothetical protein HUN04_23130 [Desulfobacter sp.]|nr:MAG: hypothetical protein HUN04_23130 [Desulfobacter sp.]
MDSMMNNIWIGLVIGMVAGIIDVTPMILRKLDRFSCLSAFFHWVALGLIIPFVTWEVRPWLKGLIIAELTAVPIMIIVYPRDAKAVFPMAVFSAVLGAGVGAAGAVFAG